MKSKSLLFTLDHLKRKSRDDGSLGGQSNDNCVDGGLSGSFVKIQPELLPRPDACPECLDANLAWKKNGFQLYGQTKENKPEILPRVKKVRFYICILALWAMSLSQMSRVILNVSIVEMTKSAKSVHQIDNEGTTMGSNEFVGQITTTMSNNTMILPTDEVQEAQDLDVRYDWSVKAQNFLIASLYVGYIPSMLLSGGLVINWGAKYLLLACVLGSSLINLLTPIVASYSFTMLVCLRMTLGVIQGGLIPASFDLFNRWLTSTEISIFVPLVKVFMPIGILLGSMLPGLAVSLNFTWPAAFYVAGVLCAIWSLVWFLLATSSPDTNPLVDANELEKITRKKRILHPPLSAPVKTVSAQVPTSLDMSKKCYQTEAVVRSEDKLKSLAENKTIPKDAMTSTSQQGQTERLPTPWLLIISHPSVIALIIVKFSYNLGMDFIILELAVYLKRVHRVSVENISAILSGGSIMQLFLVVFVGWLAKALIAKRVFGLSCTKWRKIFQGTSNFSMALIYFAIPHVPQYTHFWLLATIIMVIYFFWMLGAAGECMLPYDLSNIYPATIAGLTQAVSVLSGVALPSLCGMILGEDDSNPEPWNLLFNLIASSLAIGGLVFVCVIKAKPFLPGEKPISVPDSA